MTIIAIHARTSHTVLFSGEFPSLRHCAEAAVASGVSLANADLHDANLANASLDGANLQGADLSGADCSGANLSETNLSGVCAQRADMTLACLAQSRLVAADFTDASFGGTIVTDAYISDCVFSCPSTFTLPFAEARLGTNTYRHENRTPLLFTAAPLVVTGLPRRLVFLDDAALVGSRVTPRQPQAAQALDALCRSYG